MKAEFVVAILVALLSSGIWQVILPKLLDWKNRKAIAAQRYEDARNERLQHERETWMDESKDLYASVKAKCLDCEEELKKTREELAATRRAVYRLLEDLEDDVIPMLMVPDVEPRDIRVAARAAVQRCRGAL